MYGDGTSLQLRNAEKKVASFAKKPRLPMDVFERLKIFPDPIKKVASDSYEDFSDVYGKLTTEKDRPSLAKNIHKEKPTKPFRMTAETVCDVVVCGYCLKPRCVYSKRKLNQSEKIEFHRCKEDYMYTCGGTMLPENSDLFSICCPEILQSCEEVVSPHYYSSRLQCDMCCHVCGAFGDLRPISEELQRSF